MITRRYLRVKVLQAIYAVEKNPKEEFLVSEKNLENAVQNCHVLTVYFLSLLPEIVRYRILRLEELKEKINPTVKTLIRIQNLLTTRLLRKLKKINRLNSFAKKTT
jgi:N utilization substance protein B